MHAARADLPLRARSTGLHELALRSGRNESALIREAIDDYLEREQPHQRLAQLRQACGIWAGRDDLPDWPQLRQELDRHGPFPC